MFVISIVLQLVWNFKTLLCFNMIFSFLWLQDIASAMSHLHTCDPPRLCPKLKANNVLLDSSYRAHILAYTSAEALGIAKRILLKVSSSDHNHTGPAVTTLLSFTQSPNKSGSWRLALSPSRVSLYYFP